jgi:4-hydroxybenzoate polyprenyltransferase
MFLVKELTIAAALPILGTAGAYAATGRFSLEAFLGTLTVGFLGFTVQPAVNDATDIEEDRQQGVQSLAVRLDWPAKLNLMLAGVLVVIVAIPVFYWLGEFNVWLPVVGLTGVVAYLVFFLFTRHDIPNDPVRGRKFVHLYVLIVEIAFLIGALNI